MSDESMTALKEAAEKLGRQFEEFKASNDARLLEIEKKGAADPVLVDKVDKLGKSLDQFEAINAKLTKAEADAKAAKDALDGIETKLNRPGVLQVNPAEHRREIRARANVWANAVVRSYAVGVANLGADAQKALAEADAEYKSLSVTNDVTGGYLAPREYVMEIIKAVTEISPARSVARVRTTNAKEINIPKRTGQFAAVRVTEQGTRSETTGETWGMVSIDAPEMYALIDISMQNLEDSAFDLESEISDEATTQFAVKEGAEFCSGTGVGQLEGIITNGDIGTSNSGAALTVTADGFFTVFHAIKTAYTRNANWLLNRATLASVRKLKDGEGNYLWLPGLMNGVPNTILGAPYVEMPDMPSEGAGLKPVAFGDFFRGYTILDRIAMQMLRDQYTQATSGNIRFIFRRRVGGRVVLAEAMRTMTCST